MKVQYKYGLIIGGIGLVMNVFVSTAFGICGPLIALVAGGAAGYMVGRQGDIKNKGEGARMGALAGSITGALMLLGQVIGGLLSLSLVRSATFLGPLGDLLSSDVGIGEIYYGIGIAVSLCSGLVGIIASALAGAGGAYLSTPENAESEILT